MSYCKPFKRGVSWRSQNFGENATIYGPHSGNDDAAPIGTPVHAAGNGYIEWAGEFDDTYLDNLLWLLKMGGNIAVLNCGADKPSFVYGHMHSFTVKRGDKVRKGQVIGYSGNTGTATTGAHLHTEAIPPGYALNSPMLGRVNPDIYLTEWPEDLNIGSLSYASESIKPTAAEPKEWDEMASEEQIEKIVRRVVWGGPNGTMIHNYRLGRGEYPETTLGAIEGRLQNEILPAVVVGPLQQQLGGLAAKVDALATALAAKPDNPLTKEEALAQLDASVKASFGEYTPVLVRSDTVTEGATSNG